MLRTQRRRPGFSLLELVVVLLILSILGGLVLAVMPNLIKRTHLAKCSVTIPELTKTWMRSYAANVRYPDVLDSLLEDSGTLASTLPGGLTSQASADTLTQADVDALRSVGITRVVDLRAVNLAAGESATYDATPNSPPLGPVPERALAAGGGIARLNIAAHVAAGNPLNLKRHINRNGTTNPNVRYIVFGVGPSCSAVGTGKLIQEAPVHFGADDSINPDQAYQRYLVVFSLTSDAAGTVTAAFETAAGNDATGPSSAESHTRQFYQDQSKSE
jgi:prepilin-type N-terminal cleavage/methylation domain-containing protein